MDLSNTETALASGAAAAVWAWPYILDFLADAETRPETKRAANKVLSWLTGVSIGGYSFDTIDGGTRELMVTAGTGVLAALAARWGLEVSHQATQGTPGREGARSSSLRGPSVDELAQGDRIPIRTKAALKLSDRRANKVESRRQKLRTELDDLEA